MKNHTIKTPTAELLIVELPRKADVEIFPNSIEIYNQFTGQEETIKGHYTLLGKADEIREEDARELVQYLTRRDLTITPKNYSKGKDGRFEDITFTESLLSLLESKIYWENPLGTKRNVEKIASFKSEIAGKHLITLWHEADQKTFDRNRSIIFKKLIEIVEDEKL